MKIRRREFLIGSAAGLGGAVLGHSAELWGQDAPGSSGFDPFEMVTLGDTKIKVSRVGLGTGSNASGRDSNQIRRGEDVFLKVIRTAYEKGIRLFDMADMYGSHPYFATAMAGVPRDKYAIVSKIWMHPGKALPEPERPDADVVVERFLKELKTDYIDIVQMHCVRDKDWPTKFEKQLNILESLKKKGVIRAHGCSCHSLDALKTAAAEPWVDVVHTRINPYGASMDDSPVKVVPVLRDIHSAGKGLIGMKIIGNGKFTNDPEKINHTIDFVLNLRCVDTMIVGMELPEQIDDLANRIRQTPKRSESLPIPDVPKN